MSRHSFSFLASLLTHISIFLIIFWSSNSVKPEEKVTEDYSEEMVSFDLGSMIANKQIVSAEPVKASSSVEPPPTKATSQPQEVAKSQKVEPQEVAKSQKVTKPQPQEVVKPQKVVEPQKVVKSQEVTKPKETVKPQKVIKPQEVVKPQKVDTSQADARAKAQAEADARAKAQAEADARAKAQAEADARAKAQAEADARAKAQAEANARAKAQAEADARAKAQAEADARAKAQAEADARAKAKKNASSQSINAYRAGLQKAIDRSAKKNYPSTARKQRKQGIVKVRFTLTSSGQITNVSVVGSSGNDSLDKGAVKALKRLGKYKPPPENFPKTQEVPVRFRLPS